MSFKISDKIHTLSAFKDNKITILTTQGEAEVKAQKFLLKTTTDNGGTAVDLSECECVRYNGVKSDGKIVLVNLSPIDENYTDDGLCQLEVTEDMTSADGKVYGEIEVVYNGTASLKYYGINLLVEPSASSVAKSSASDLSALNDLTERMSNAEEKLERLSTGEAQTRVYFKKNCDDWGEPRIYVWKSSTSQNSGGTQEPYSLDGCNPWTWENSPYLKKSKDNESLYYYDIAPVYDRVIFFCSQDSDGVNLSDTGQFWYQTATLHIPSLPYYPVPCYYQHPLGWDGVWGNLETSTFPIYIQAPNPKGVLSTVEPVTDEETGEVKYYEFSEYDNDPQYPQVDEFKVTVDGEEYEVKRIGYTPQEYLAFNLKVAYYKCDVPVDCEKFTLTHVNEDDGTYSISYDFWHSCYNYPVFYYKNIGSGTQYSESFAQFDGDYDNNFMLYISYNRNETKLYGDVWNKWGASNTANIASNTANIASNTANIATNTANITRSNNSSRIYFHKEYDEDNNCYAWGTPRIYLFKSDIGAPYDATGTEAWAWEDSPEMKRVLVDGYEHDGYSFPTEDDYYSYDGDNEWYYYDCPTIYDKVIFFYDYDSESTADYHYYQTSDLTIPTSTHYSTPCYYQSPYGFDGIWGDFNSKRVNIYLQSFNTESSYYKTIYCVTCWEGNRPHSGYTDGSTDPSESERLTIEDLGVMCVPLNYDDVHSYWLIELPYKFMYLEFSWKLPSSSSFVNNVSNSYQDLKTCCYNYPVLWLNTSQVYMKIFDGQSDENFMFGISYNRNETKLYGDVWNKWGASTTALSAESKQRLDERGYTRVYFKKNCDSWSNVRIVIYRDTCDSPYFDEDNSVNAQMQNNDNEMLPADEENLYYYDVPNIYDKIYFRSDDEIPEDERIDSTYYHTAASIIPTNEYYTTPCYFQSPIGYDGIWGDLDTNTYPIYIQMPPRTYTGGNKYAAWWCYDDPRTMKVLADGVELELYKMGNIPDDYTGNTNDYYRCNIPIDCESFVLNYNEDNVTGRAMYYTRDSTSDSDGTEQGQAPCTVPTSTKFDFYHSCYNFPVFYLGYDTTYSAGVRLFTYYWTAFSGTTNDKFYFRMKYTMGEYRMYRELASKIGVVEAGYTSATGIDSSSGNLIRSWYYKVGRFINLYFPKNNGYTLYYSTILEALTTNGYLSMPLPYPYETPHNTTNRIGFARMTFWHEYEYTNYGTTFVESNLVNYELDIIPYYDASEKTNYSAYSEVITEFRVVPKESDMDEICQYLQDTIDYNNNNGISDSFSGIFHFNNIIYFTSTGGVISSKNSAVGNSPWDYPYYYV